jgi:hypothetical protein
MSALKMMIRAIYIAIRSLWMAFSAAATFFAVIVILTWLLKVAHIRTPLDSLAIPMISTVDPDRVRDNAIRCVQANLGPEVNPVRGTPAGLDWLDAYMDCVKARGVGDAAAPDIKPTVPFIDQQPMDEQGKAELRDKAKRLGKKVNEEEF